MKLWINWSSLLSGFSLSYNTTPHSSTGFTPVFLLRGYHPRTPINFTTKFSGINNSVNQTLIDQAFTDPDAREFIAEFQFHRSLAKEALKLAQSYQEKYNNAGCCDC